MGPDAIQRPGFVLEDVGAGMAMHFLLAVIVGVIYTALLRRIGVSPISGGLITAAVLYLLGFWALPLAFPTWLAPFWLPPTGRALQAAAHGAYGVVFGFAYGRFTESRR